MEATLPLNTKSGNFYLYDLNLKELINVHPLIIKIAEWNKELSKEKVLDKLITEEKYLQEDAEYYWKRYLFYKESGLFGQRDLDSLLGAQISGQNVERCLANCNDIVFQVTQQCNLKCKYCCYGDLYEQPLFTGDKTMSFSMVKTILDYMVTYWNSELFSSYDNEIIIGFYGGEPLVNYRLIEQVVDYLSKLDLNKPIHFRFSMTTNALLLDKYMDFLVKHDFHLLISLDGNEEHDKLRVDTSGKPSFQRVYGNIKKLQNCYPDFFQNKVEFNSVLNSYSDAEAVFNFVYENFGKVTSLEAITPQGLKTDKIQEFEKIYQPYHETAAMRERTSDTRLKEMRECGYFFYYHLRNSYRHYAELLQADMNSTRIPTGTCLPFMKKFFVLSSGEILVCERIGLDEYLGKVDDVVHLDFDAIAAKYNTLYDLINRQCKHCYNAEFCSACILQLPQKNGNHYCDSIYTKEDVSVYLKQIVSYLEQNRNKFYMINKSVFA